MTTPIHRAAAPAGRTVPTPGTDTAEFVDRMMSRRPAVGFALAVVRADRGPELVTRGVADVTSRRPVGPDTAFRIASITKTLTAVAVMTLLEDGLIGLDDPVDAHLRAFRLTGPGGERAVTVRHLLTHTSGLPEVLSLPHALRPDFGESVPPGARFPSLAEYYGGTLRAVAEPGRVFCYTNHGPATTTAPQPLASSSRTSPGVRCRATCANGYSVPGAWTAPTSAIPVARPRAGPPATA
jgi:CubicO group peptidase (beta-lactamase class C family)